MDIVILGTRGIPNHYGGFEQFAQYLSLDLVERGHRVTVFNSHTHPYQESSYEGVELVHAYDPEDKIGTVGQFIYDFNCIRKLKSIPCDIVLQLGYTSSSIWGRLLPKKAIIVTNMDGLEWKRTKFSPKVQRFLKHAEKWAVRTSNHWVADSIGIQDYLKNTFNISSTYIPYGAQVFQSAQKECLTDFGLLPFQYNMLVARLEPENNIEMILDGVTQASDNTPFVVVGKHETNYGRYLSDKYKADQIRFIGGIYNQDILSSIRYYSKLYFHGHSVGGTNPSLLEAMACNAFVCAHQNIFNESILGKDAYYFKTNGDVARILTNYSESFVKVAKAANIAKITNQYSWEKICDQYEDLFKKLSIQRNG